MGSKRDAQQVAFGSAESEAVTDWLLGGILPRQGIKHQGDVSIIHTDLLLEPTHKAIDALKSIRDVMIKMLLSWLVRHRS